jgi:hypothetical protein
MRRYHVVVIAIAIWMLLAISFAQDTDRFTSVGGDYGKSIITKFKSDDAVKKEASIERQNGTLWDWGSAPKGSLIVDGSLMKDPKYYLKNLTVTTNWLGDSLTEASSGSGEEEYSYFDPVTGQPVKTYRDQSSGQIYYIITDPETQKQIYVYFNPVTGQPIYTRIAPGGLTSGTGETGSSFALPPIFSSGNAQA